MVEEFLNIYNVFILLSVVNKLYYFQDDFLEVVFVGCLNVGKLSFINMFFGCKNLVCMLSKLGKI